MTNLQKRFEEVCLKYHFDKRLKHSFTSDVFYNVNGCAIIDVDKTLTGDSTLHRNVFERLYRYPEVSKESDKIEECIKTIDSNQSNVKEGFDKLINVLKKVHLKEQKIIDACLDAAIDTPPAPRTTDFILDLKDRDIKRAVLTYSFENVLVPWYKRKIGVFGTHLRGLKLRFHNGYLINYDIGGNYGKATFAENLVRELGLTPDDVFAIDDDPVLDKSLVLMLGIGFVIWLDEDQNRRKLEAEGMYTYPGEIPLVFPEARANMQSLTPCVDMWRRARAVSKIKSPTELIQINQEFKNMRNSIERCKQENTRMQIERFINSCEKLFDIGYPIISTVLSGVENLFSDLEIAFYAGEDTKSLIQQAETIYTALRDENPESQLTEDILNEIKLCRP